MKTVKPSVSKAVGSSLAVAVLCAYTVVPGAALAADGTTSSSTSSSTSSTTSSVVDKLSTNASKIIDNARSAQNDVDKDETVYVFSKADGSTKDIVVSDWLKNTRGESTIQDRSTLSDIENVEGDQQYTTTANGNLSWAADGSDIYYQGTSTAKLPMTVKVSYTLDGKSVTPEEIAGKSGKVTIRFDYTNESYETKTINGKETKVYTPFIVMTATVLQNANFSNIQISNGKIVNDGDRTVVTGFAFPGMQEDLGVDSGTVDIPSYVEVTADATDFQLDTTVTMASSDMLNGVDASDIDTSDLAGSMNKLTSAMSQLEDGSSQLYTGLQQLADGASQVDGGAQQLSSGATQVADGTTQLATQTSGLGSGTEELKSGAEQLAAGLAQAESNTAASGALGGGSTQLKVGSASLSAALTTKVAPGVAALNKALNVDDGSGKPMTTDAASLATGAAQVSSGAAAISAGLGTTGTTDQKTVAGGVAGLNQALNVDDGSGNSLVTDASKVATAAGAANSAVSKAQGDVQALVAAGTLTQEQATALLTDLGTAAAYGKGASDGATAVSGGVSQVAGGVSGLNAALNVNDGSGKPMTTDAANLATGAAQVSAGATAISAGIGSATDPATLAGGVAALNYAFNVDDGTGATHQDASGAAVANTLVYDAAALAAGNSSLAGGLQSLDQGLVQLTAGANKLSAGTQQLAASSPALAAGIAKLNAGAAQLSTGASTLAANTPALAAGAQSAVTGSMQLSDGLKQFDEEGVSRIVNAFSSTGNLGELQERLTAMVDTGKDYDNFSGIADGRTGKVQFIYETDSITSDDK